MKKKTKKTKKTNNNKKTNKSIKQKNKKGKRLVWATIIRIEQKGIALISLPTTAQRAATES